jgi:uncharacterized protein (DUF433 family)
VQPVKRYAAAEAWQKSYDERRVRTWQLSIGHNVPPWKASPASGAAHGYFKDTRMPISTVFENLESGASIEEIMEWFDVTREQIIAVLEFTARSLDAPSPATRSMASIDAHTV